MSENSEAAAEQTPAAPAKNPRIAALKARISALKIERQTALETGDRAKLKIARRRIGRAKRRIRQVS